MENRSHARLEYHRALIRPDWRRRYIHLAMRRHKSIANVAMGRRLAVRLDWMWRNGCECSPSLEFGSYPAQLGTGHGVEVEHRALDGASRTEASNQVA